MVLVWGPVELMSGHPARMCMNENMLECPETLEDVLVEVRTEVRI